MSAVDGGSSGGPVQDPTAAHRYSAGRLPGGAEEEGGGPVDAENRAKRWIF